MDRTFNTFIDNGMFIAAKLLNTIVDDLNIDSIRKKHGFTKLVYASSMLKGGRAIERSSLVGGHAGGLSGIDGKDEDNEKKN